VNLEAIPVKAGREVASNLLSTLAADGIHAWIKSVKTHHSPTFSHSLEVAALAGWFSSQLGWSEKDCIQVTAGGLLHDIGKSKIPLSVLDKPALLNNAERNLIRKHARFGYEIIKDRPEVDRETKEMVFYHHELLDGSGYPFGLSGDSIGKKVRLTTICDVFSALTEERAYKTPLSNREAFAIMNKMEDKLDQSLYLEFRSRLMPTGFGKVRRA